MQKIADQRNGEPREIALVIADRIHIEQPLRRMCMPAVARIDDMQMRRAMLRNQERRAASRMPDDAHIRPHRAQGMNRSSSDSPFCVEDAGISRFSTSADKYLAAISNVERVRVECSKKRLKTDLPRSNGLFLIPPPRASINCRAVSRICVMDSRGSPSRVSKCFSSPCAFNCRGFTGIFVEELLQDNAGRNGVERRSIALRCGRYG